MKRKIINIGIIMTIATIVLVICSGCGKKEVDVDNFKSLYLYSGTSLYGSETYSITGDTMNITQKYSVIEEETPDTVTTVKLNEKELNDIKEVLKKYNNSIQTWKGEHRNTEVVGGTDFSFKIIDENDNKIEIRCSNDAHPENGKNFEREMLDLLRRIKSNK